MFFSRRLNAGLLEDERRQQRRFLYAQLYKALRLGEFSLVWPVNQVIDPKNSGMKGYCHGYNEVWTKYVLDAGEEEPFLSEEAWVSLIKDENYDFSSMPLSNTIKLAQTFMPSGPIYRARGEAVDCLDLNVLLEAILAGSLGTLPTAFFQASDQYHVFVICLGDRKDDLGCFSVLDIASRRSNTATWHEARLCVDPRGRVHWFDANAGWFRSRTAHPGIDDLKRDLSLIFEILQYPEKYSVVSVFETHLMDTSRLHAQRLSN